MDDFGLFVGTGIFMLFGLFFAVLVPTLMLRSEGRSEDTERLAGWLRWLGVILIVLSVGAAVAIALLPKELP